jgi:hypothetical protein
MLDVSQDIVLYFGGIPTCGPNADQKPIFAITSKSEGLWDA